MLKQILKLMAVLAWVFERGGLEWPVGLALAIFCFSLDEDDKTVLLTAVVLGVIVDLIFLRRLGETSLVFVGLVVSIKILKLRFGQSLDLLLMGLTGVTAMWFKSGIDHRIDWTYVLVAAGLVLLMGRLGWRSEKKLVGIGLKWDR